MDAFLAALRVGAGGRVIGVDMTERQLEKAASLAERHGVRQLEFRAGFIEELPVEDATVDVVISNGVINLSPRKAEVFSEIARVLRPGGRVAIPDIVTEHALGETIRCDAGLWASCIWGADQRDFYLALMSAAGLPVSSLRSNPSYRFLSQAAQRATARYGGTSVSLAAAREPLSEHAG
jgi:arsenite methyltransferase